MNTVATLASLYCCEILIKSSTHQLANKIGLYGALILSYLVWRLFG